MDIYFQDGYARLYEQIEGGVAEVFRFRCKYGEVKHQFIRREIQIRLTDGVTRYDLITPYGYGGPVVLSETDGTRKELCRAFGSAFRQHCLENHIVSEFVRFHPLADNAADFREIYDPVCIRNTVGTNLQAYEDPVESEFSRRCRKTIRLALGKGVTYRTTEAPQDIHGFTEIYYNTMDRNHARSFYYFGEEYFENVLKLFRANVLYVEALYDGKTIAAGLFFISDGVIHAHLSGTLREYLHLSPAYVIKYATALWGKERGYKTIHYGGGTSNAPDNPLFCFKKKFGQNTQYPFHVGRKVWDPEAYALLCRAAAVPETTDFFPSYRSVENGSEMQNCTVE